MGEEKKSVESAKYDKGDKISLDQLTTGPSLSNEISKIYNMNQKAIILNKKLQPCFVALQKSLTWNMFTKLNLHLNQKIEISKSLKPIN